MTILGKKLFGGIITRPTHLIEIPFGWLNRESLLIAIAIAFVLLNGLALSLALEARVVLTHLYAPLIWAVVIISVYILLQKYRKDHDPYLLPIISLMTGWGLLLVDRLAPIFLARQVRWLVIGMFALILTCLLPRHLRFLRRYRYSWLIFGIVLLGATLLFGVNPSGAGATLWLKVPFFGQIYFQPSEILKILLVIFLASYFDERGRILKIVKGTPVQRTAAYLGPLGLMWGFCVVMLIWQQDLGAAALFVGVFLAMLYLATGDWIFVAGGFSLLIVAGLVGYFFFDDFANIIETVLGNNSGQISRFDQLGQAFARVNEIIKLRIDTWVDPWIEANSRGFQIVQSLYALAAGGIFGDGIAQGFPTFIPVVHSDFAYAAIVEEWGLIGGLMILGCFAVLVHRGLHIAAKSNRPFDLFLAAGITVIFATQTFLITAGVTKIIPLTGVTLPFISYGGSSMLASCIMIGLLLNISTKPQSPVSELSSTQKTDIDGK